MVVTGLLLIPVARATYRVNEGEGYFRFRHARLKEFAESGTCAVASCFADNRVNSSRCEPCLGVAVVMYNGQAAEQKAAQASFKMLYWRMRSLFKRTFYLMFYVSTQSNVVNALSYAVVALDIIKSGTINGAVVTPSSTQQAASGLVQFISNLLTLPSVYSNIGTIAGLTHRVCQMLEALEQLEVGLVGAWAATSFEWRECAGLNERVCGVAMLSQASARRMDARCTFEESPSIGVTGLCCRTPDGNVLFDNMTFRVQPGERLLIMGPSGVGKSSLLRIIAGLWPIDDGIICRYYSERNSLGNACWLDDPTASSRACLCLRIFVVDGVQAWQHRPWRTVFRPAAAVHYPGNAASASDLPAHSRCRQ